MEVKESVKNYYSKVLTTAKDLKTNACCAIESLPSFQQEILSEIEPEIKDRFYGCGAPFPSGLEGAVVLDLGCGSGRDVYMLSKLVGEKGTVIGVDMTKEQLAVAKKYQKKQADKFGFSQSNVRFEEGYVENLSALGIEDDSVDVIVSNCVINLSPDKPQVFAEMLRVLKPGGELYFSDVFADRRIPEELRQDEELYGECLSGALYIEDFRRILQDLGCHDFRIVTSRALKMGTTALEKKVGDIGFFSITVRAFKLNLEDRCEDYGQVLRYKGGLLGAEHCFVLDDHHIFQKGVPVLVCGNTADMLTKSRFSQYFEVFGDKSLHLGLFDCADEKVNSDKAAPSCC